MKLNDHAYFLNSSAQDPTNSKKLVYKESTISDFATNLYFDAIMQPANAATYYYGYIQVTDVINGLTKKGYSLYDAHKAFLNSARGINSSQGHPHRIAGFIPCRWTSINPKGML